MKPSSTAVSPPRERMVEVDCPWSSRQTLCSRRGEFKRLGTDATQMAVAAGLVGCSDLRLDPATCPPDSTVDLIAKLAPNDSRLIRLSASQDQALRFKLHFSHIFSGRPFKRVEHLLNVSEPVELPFQPSKRLTAINGEIYRWHSAHPKMFKDYVGRFACCRQSIFRGAR